MSDFWMGLALGLISGIVLLFTLALIASFRNRPGCLQCDELFAEYKELDDEYRDAVELLETICDDLETLADTPDAKLREGVEQIADGINEWFRAD